jgi:hypothetical protein
MAGFFMPWRSSIDSDKFAAMMDILSGNGCAHDLIMLATLVVVFVVGFRC